MTVKRIFLMFGLILTTLTGVRAQALFPAPSSTELRKGNFLYNKATAGHIRTTILPASGDPDESYRLEVTQDSILIDAASAKGVFYARQALEQLARHGKGKYVVAGFTVRHATHGADLCSMKAATSSAKRK